MSNVLLPAAVPDSVCTDASFVLYIMTSTTDGPIPSVCDCNIL